MLWVQWSPCPWFKAEQFAFVSIVEHRGKLKKISRTNDLETSERWTTLSYPLSPMECTGKFVTRRKGARRSGVSPWGGCPSSRRYCERTTAHPSPSTIWGNPRILMQRCVTHVEVGITLILNITNLICCRNCFAQMCGHSLLSGQGITFVIKRTHIVTPHFPKMSRRLRCTGKYLTQWGAILADNTDLICFLDRAWSGMPVHGLAIVSIHS